MDDPNNRNVPAPSQDDETNQASEHTLISAKWSAPLPPPSALAEFDRVVPGSAARIIDEFEAEARHRRELERRQASFIIRDVHIGQALAALFAVSGLGVAALAIWLGHPVTATILGGGTIAPIVYAFLRQTWRKSDDD